MSDEALFSAHWHRVRDVRPRLAPDVVATRHVYRGRPSWVLHRRSSSGFHRLDGGAFALLARLDGQRSVGEIWERAMVEREAAAPTQDAWISLLSALQCAELLLVDRRVAAEQLFERRDERQSRERRERRLNPLYLRFALYDPDRLLTRLEPLARLMFSRAGLLAWCLLFVAGVFALSLGGAQIWATVGSPQFPSQRLVLLMLLAYPPLKLLHELGHALAVKRCGGEVHETGFALMVLMPLPYVDAGASAAFSDKRARMLVAAAGILVELAFACIGALLHAFATGVIAEIGLALLLVGGLSTLLINGNPLLRFDGYYLLADALEIPNLASRSRRAALQWVHGVLSGSPADPNVLEDAGERRWLLGYGIVSAVYRTALMLWIAWWLSGEYLLFGVALALYTLGTTILLPLGRGLRAVADDTRLQSLRALLIVSGLPLAGLLVLFAVPLPHADLSRGVVWLPDAAVVRAASGCEVTSASVRAGQRVDQGQSLFTCLDPELALMERDLMARGDELDARLAGRRDRDPVEYARLTAERESTERALDDVRDRLVGGHYTAAMGGRFDASGTVALEGRALARGDIAGYVVPALQRTVRVALDQNVESRLGETLQRIELRLPDEGQRTRVHRSAIVERTLRPSLQLPSPALGTVGGGEHEADPSGDGSQVLRPVYDVELAWPEEAEPTPVGAHVLVRFVHAPGPLAGRLFDALRRTFNDDGRT